MNRLQHKFEEFYHLAQTLAAKNCHAVGVSREAQQSSWQTLKTIKQIAKEVRNG